MVSVTGLWIHTIRQLIPNSLQSRLLVTYLVLVLLAIGSLIVWAGYRLESSSNSQAQRNLEVDALRLASGLAEPLQNLGIDPLEKNRILDTLLSNFALSFDGTLAILDTDLHLIAASEFNDDNDDDHDDHDDEENSEERGFGKDEDDEDRSDEDDGANLEQKGREYSQKDDSDFVILTLSDFSFELDDIDLNIDTVTSWRSGDRILASAPVVAPQGETKGLLLVSISSDRAAADANRNWVILLSGGGVILFVTAMATVLVARQISGPVKRVTRISEAMAAGDLGGRVVPQGPQEIKRLGRAFNQMSDRVEETLARQRAFVADAAHELRSPLTSLALRAEMLQQYSEMDDQTRQSYITQLILEIDRMRDLAEHLLALSRMDSGQAPQMALVDIGTVLRQLAREMAPIFESADVLFETQIADDLPSILCDSEGLIIAVRNLLDNAIQYTPAEGKAILTAHAENGGILIIVTDTGQGIPPEYLDRVFDRFYRVDKARSRRQGSTGLGLSLVRAIVQAHGGVVELTSTIGVGSTFSVHLPRDPATFIQGENQ